MDQSPEYETLREWLSKAWLQGMVSERRGFRPIGMWVMLGFDWQQKEQEMAVELMEDMIAKHQPLQWWADRLNDIMQ